MYGIFVGFIINSYRLYIYFFSCSYYFVGNFFFVGNEDFGNFLFCLKYYENYI